MHNKNQNILLIAIILILTLPLLFAIHKDQNLHIDEINHLDQIHRFFKGEKHLNPVITTIPGYHLFLAVIARTFNNSSLDFLRTLNYIISLLSIFIFYLLIKKIYPDCSFTKTLQYAFLPILFPFFFLLYTDVFSLLLILLSLFFALKKNYTLTALSGIASLVVRQNNIIWFLFLFIFIYLQENQKNSVKFSKKRIRNHLKKSWLFLTGVLAFAVFTFINKGIAIGDQSGHPLGIYFGNIYFLLFLFFFLFLPLNLANLPRIAEKIKHNRKILVFLLALFILYLLTFKNTHPYNQSQYSFFLRNQILLFFTSSSLLKMIFFLPIAYSTLSLWVTKLPNKALLFTATILYLLPSWLIEQRYYLIPFALFLAFKEKKSNTIEYLAISLYITLSLYFFWGIKYGKFFL